MMHALKSMGVALLATTALVLPASAESTSAWRLFIGDHTDPKVTAIDVATGEVLASFPIGSPAVLYSTKSQAGVYAVQGTANQVSAFKTGIEIEDHGDHGDLHVSPPEAVEAVVAGEKPVHFVEHDGHLALFYDGEGVGRVVDETEWLAGEPVIREIVTAKAHHGVVVPWGEFAIGTDPTLNAETTRPQGVFTYDSDNTIVGDMVPCPLLHGEAASGNLLAIACADGILLATGSGAPKFEKLAYGENLPKGTSSTLLGGVGLQYFLGNYGPDKVVIIDPAEAEAFRLVELPMRRVHFAVDPSQPRNAYIFTEDGKLNLLDVVSGKIVKSLALTEAYSMDGEWDLPRPRIAVAGNEIAVTDPKAGVVHIVDTATFAKVRDIAVEGLPFTIVAVGGTGAVH